MAGRHDHLPASWDGASQGLRAYVSELDFENGKL
jgi:hypothetical protein